MTSMMKKSTAIAALLAVGGTTVAGTNVAVNSAGKNVRGAGESSVMKMMKLEQMHEDLDDSLSAMNELNVLTGGNLFKGNIEELVEKKRILPQIGGEKKTRMLMSSSSSSSKKDKKNKRMNMKKIDEDDDSWLESLSDS
jgi:predicted small secreted protein